MQLRFFTIPVNTGDETIAELNRFLAGHRILSIDRQLVIDGSNSAWAICVIFDDGGARPISAKRGKVDFKEVLSEPEFAVFARLRALRKELADGEGVPAYALFTNEQLAEMVRRRVTLCATLGEIPGVGDARVEKYGEKFLRILKDAALPGAMADADEDAA